MENSQFQIKNDEIDIRKYILKFISHWYLFILFVPAALLAAYYVNRYSVPEYTITSSVLIRDKDSKAGSVESVIENLSFARRFNKKKDVENEIGILRSYSLNRRVVDELDFTVSYISIGTVKESELYDNTLRFKVDFDSVPVLLYGTSFRVEFTSADTYKLKFAGNDSEIKAKTGEKVAYLNTTFEINLTGNFTYDSDRPNFGYEGFKCIVRNPVDIANSYRSKLKIEPIEEKASFLTLSLSGPVPEKEADYLNKLCEIYLLSDLEEKNLTSTNTIKFIDAQLEGIVDSLRSAETVLQDFRLSNKTIIDISSEGQLLMQKLNSLQSEKSITEIKKKYYDYLMDYIEKKNDFKDVIAPSSIGINDPLLSSLISQLSELYSEKNVAAFSAKENNPTLNLIDVKIETAHQALKENIRNIVSAAKISLDDINKRLADVQKDIQRLPVTERKLINIQRKFDLNDEIYTYLLQKKAEAGIIQASNVSDNKIVDIAIPENAVQISPNKSRNRLMALLIGLIIPVLIILIKEFLNDRIEDISLVESETNIPVLGTIGHNLESSSLIVLNKPKSSIAEAFRSLRTNIQFMAAGENKKVISVSSTISGEGKTFTSINFATILAMSSKKTLLIGLDLRRPKIHKEFDISNNIGLCTYLIGKNSYEDVICKTQIDNLYIVPSGPIPPNPAELIGTDKMKEFIEKARADFDFVIIDTPPIAVVTDALLISKFADASIFVIRYNYSKKFVLKLLLDLKERHNVKGLGIVFNDVSAKYGSNYYGYSYGYGYKYGYRYGNENTSGYYDDSEKPSFKRKMKQLFIPWSK